MKIALMHYHLRRGGVTTVLRDQYAALRGSAECIVISGEPPDGAAAEPPRGSVHVVPPVGYAPPDGPAPDPADMAAGILDAMRAAWGGLADVLHVHNPTLAKNPSLPAALRRVQEAGVPLLLQLHDLAEDGRPAAYYQSGDYPRDCHYAVINSRDREALLESGLRPDGVHLLFNVVPPIAGAIPRGERPPDTRTLLYPVRAIRRKNVGEALLLALLARGRLVVTLPPRDPSDLRRHEAWKLFARERSLSALFDAGLSRPLGELYAEARAAVSTSVNEGFGFSFLEPWSAGVCVVGRRVEHVCRDFEGAGIDLHALYGSLMVPTTGFDGEGFSTRWRSAVERAYAGFGRSISGEAAARALCSLTAGGTVDLARLDEQAQREVIARAAADGSFARELLEGSPGPSTVRKALDSPDPLLAARNDAAIRVRFGAEPYARALRAAYDAVVTTPVRQGIDRDALLDRFLRPEAFVMIGARES